MRQRRLETKRSSMGTTLGWLRLKTPLGPRSLPFVGLTVPWYRMKPLTKLGLRFLLYLGNQKVSIIPQPFVLHALRVPRLIFCPWRLVKFRAAHLKFLLQLTLPQRGQNWSRTHQERGVPIKKQSKAPNYLPLFRRTSLREKRLLRVWNWYWQLLPYHQKRLPRTRTMSLLQQPIPNFPRTQKRNL